jgi:hypothetical protein
VTSTDPGDLRRRITPVEGGGTDRPERRSLTMRPYTWEDLGRLLCVYRNLHRVEYPKGQLISLASTALENRLEGSSLFVYQVARAPDSQAAVLTEIVAEFGAHAPPPWAARYGRSTDGRETQDYATVLGDLVEMYGIVKEDDA